MLSAVRERGGALDFAEPDLMFDQDFIERVSNICAEEQISISVDACLETVWRSATISELSRAVDIAEKYLTLPCFCHWTMSSARARLEQLRLEQHLREAAAELSRTGSADRS